MTFTMVIKYGLGESDFILESKLPHQFSVWL